MRAEVAACPWQLNQAAAVPETSETAEAAAVAVASAETEEVVVAATAVISQAGMEVIRIPVMPNLGMACCSS